MTFLHSDHLLLTKWINIFLVAEADPASHLVEHLEVPLGVVATSNVVVVVPELFQELLLAFLCLDSALASLPKLRDRHLGPSVPEYLRALQCVCLIIPLYDT